MKEFAFQTGRFLFVRSRPFALSSFDYSEPLLVEMTNAFEAGYATFYETQY